MTEYVYENTVLNYICPNGNRGSITWGDWQQEKRCMYKLCQRGRFKTKLKKIY